MTESHIDQMLRMGSLAARIVVSDNGSPIRPIINGRHRKPTGRYTSLKAGGAMPWEDKREREFFWISEADTAVVSYLAQPHRLEIEVGEARPLIYFPDIRRDLADGSVEIREIKKHYDPSDDPDYHRKLDLAKSIYERLGWSFRIIEGAELAQGRVLTNAKRIQRDRDVVVDTRHRTIAENVVAGSGGRARMGDVREALSPSLAGEALLFALIVRRVVSVDLHSRLDDDAGVTLVRDQRLADRAA